jgi:hypothetical protein
MNVHSPAVPGHHSPTVPDFPEEWHPINTKYKPSEIQADSRYATMGPNEGYHPWWASFCPTSQLKILDAVSHIRQFTGSISMSDGV